MYESCLEKQEMVKKYFSSCESPDDKYEKIIELGRRLGRVADTDRTESHLVKGCQSRMYLVSELRDGRVFYQAESDSLISAGLAVLLLEVFSGESPETILKCEPSYLEELGINASLTMNRANGLASLHLHMKQEALKHLVAQAKGI